MGWQGRLFSCRTLSLAGPGESFGLDGMGKLNLEIAGPSGVVEVDLVVVTFPDRAEPDAAGPLEGKLQAALPAPS